MNKIQLPIGVFDSGLGGLSVAHTIHQLLPNEDIIYYGDSANAPYGNRTKHDVLNLSHACTDYLIHQGVKAIVIACNTATSAAAASLRNAYNIPIIGMEPALKPASNFFPSGNILVLATEMTLKEEKFSNLLNLHRHQADITLMPASKFVTLVESGNITQADVDSILDSLIGNASYDAVVLGCTHFIFLKPFISAYFKHAVTIFDGNIGTVKHLKKCLVLKDLLTTNTHAGRLTIQNSAGQLMIEKSKKILKALD